MIKINRSTRTLIIVMGVLVVFAILISQWYYRDLNASVDPRVVPARELYKKYNLLAEANQIDSVFLLLDTIEGIYREIPHYNSAFEVGVLNNNRAASWLTLALYSEMRDSTEKDSLVMLAEEAVRKSIKIYESWEKRFREMNEEQVRSVISEEFMYGLDAYSIEEQEKYLENRIGEILESQEEIRRRTSVSYTNLGIVYRYREQYDSAAFSYKKALDLWDRNLTAENNLNLLLGQPLKKRNIIQRMFPPDRL